MGRLENRIALVTGGSGDLGSAMCEAFAREGADCALTYFQNEAGARKAAAAVEKHGRRALVVRTDTRQEPQVRELVEATVRTFGGLDIVVANAGGSILKPLMETTLDDFEQVMALNLRSTYLTVRHGAEPLVAQKRGKIVTMSSIHGLGGSYAWSLYSTAKAGIINFTRSIAIDLGPDNIQCNAIAPGSIPPPTDAAIRSGTALDEAWTRHTPAGRHGRADEVAAAAVYLASAESDYVTGQVLSVDGGISAGHPVPSFRHYAIPSA